MRQHERVQHGVEGVEHPAQGSGDKGAALRARDLGKGQGEAGSHWQDSQLLIASWQLKILSKILPVSSCPS